MCGSWAWYVHILCVLRKISWIFRWYVALSCVRKGHPEILKVKKQKQILEMDQTILIPAAAFSFSTIPSKINQLFKERFLFSALKYKDGKAYCPRAAHPNQKCNFFEHCSKNSWRHISSESLFGLLILFCKPLKSSHEPIGFRLLRCRHIENFFLNILVLTYAWCL